MKDPKQSTVDMAVFVDAVVDLMARKLRPVTMKRELDLVFAAHGLRDSSSRNEVLLLCAERAVTFLQGLPDVFAADTDQGGEALEEFRVVLSEHPLPVIEPLIADEAAMRELLVAAKSSTGEEVVVSEELVTAPVDANVGSVALGNGHDGSAGNNSHGGNGHGQNGNGAHHLATTPARQLGQPACV